MTALAASTLKALCDAIAIRPRKKRRLNASQAALQVYKNTDSHWGSVAAHAVSSLKIAREKLEKDASPSK